MSCEQKTEDIPTLPHPNPVPVEELRRIWREATKHVLSEPQAPATPSSEESTPIPHRSLGLKPEDG